MFGTVIEEGRTAVDQERPMGTARVYRLAARILRVRPSWDPLAALLEALERDARRNSRKCGR